MERLLFSQVRLWIVLLVALIGLAGLVMFGAVVRAVATGHNRFGAVGEAANAVALVPSTLKELLSPTHISLMTIPQPDRFPGQAGWTFDATGPDDLPPGYLLFSRYDGAAGRHVIELTDLRSGEVVHRVEPDADQLLEGVPRDSRLIGFVNWTTARFLITHPLALPDGDLIIKENSPLWRVDACGRPRWRLDGTLFHHSTEVGLDGTLWVPIHVEPTRVEGLSPRFFDDGLAQVTPEGEILYERSMTEVMIAAGLAPVLFSNTQFDADPLHLNDIQPVLEDGPYWKAGDVFLSFRHLSMLMLFRPSTDEIVWMKQGPWAAQHDVDILDDHRIGVFSNNMQNRGSGERVEGTSEVLVYDFATDTVTSPFKALFESLDIHTESQGLFTLLPSGHLLVEETDAGRTLIFAPDGRLVAENVNRGPDGRVYQLGWSRYVGREEGDAILAGMRAQACD